MTLLRQLQHLDLDRRQEDVRFVVSEVSVGTGKFVVGSLAVLLVVGACNNADESESSQGPVASEASAYDASGGGGSATGDVPISTSGAGSSSVAEDETGVIASVVDGDTLALADGRVVRVLGIDSCEIITHSGLEARSDAQQLLRAGQLVSLRGEPGVDRDVYRRHLRYVTTPGGQDFGSAMIGFEHTGVYEGGDASVAYTAQMRRLDDGPRDCTFLPPATSATPTTTAARPIPPADPAPAPRPAPRPAPEAAPVPEPREPNAANCHSSYTPCVPDGPDLDCGDIRKLVIVTGPDEFRLDGDDNDGRGCESYG